MSCYFNPTLIEMIVYMVAMTATATALAFVLYRFAKSSGFAKGDIPLGPIKLKFDLTGAVAGFIVALAVWLTILPPSAVLPSVMVYSVEAFVDASEVPTDDIDVFVEPRATVAADGKLQGLYVIGRKEQATNRWVFPVITFSPKTPSQFDMLPIRVSEDYPDFVKPPVDLEVSGRTIRVRGGDPIRLKGGS